MSRNNPSRTGDRAITPGSRWRVDGNISTVVAVIGIDRVLVQDEEGVQRPVKPGLLQAPDCHEPASRRGRPTELISSASWAKAKQLLKDVQGVAGEGEVSRAKIESLASTWGVSRATVWRRIQRFRRERSLLTFVNRSPGPPRGAARLAADQEALIRDVARRWWRQTENATVSEIEPSVRAECTARGLASPSRATVARRLRCLRKDPDNFSGEPRAALRERVRLMRGNYEVAAALGVVQIDHTVADVFLVDPASRQPIGRPTLTVAIDVATRCVMGMCLSLEAPSSLLVALCLEHAVFPKDAWLESIGATVQWPMYGRMTALHSDNGKEFHGSAFRRGCDLNGIDVIYRPPATPRFGGHVERLIGTLMRRVRLLPGNSYSDLLRARPKRAELRASLTLDDFRWFLTEEIANYHHRTHRGLGFSPRSAWEQAWRRDTGVELPPLPGDQKTFLLDFLPTFRRVIGREGIEIFGLRYSDRTLASEVDPGRPRIIRIDPRNLSHAYLERPGGEYVRVPLRDRRWPSMSLWEWKALRKQHRAFAAGGDGEHIGKALVFLENAAGRAPTRLRRSRDAARRADWRALQAIQVLPGPAVLLEPTLVSEAASGDFAWEVLE